MTTSRKAIEQQYKVKSGRIVSPGKFEGERVYVPYFWDLYLDGGADRDDGKVFAFDVTAQDRAEFPELQKRRSVRMYEDDMGFVREL